MRFVRGGTALAACLLLTAACDESGAAFTAQPVPLACPTTAGGSVTLVVGARANSPKPEVPSEIQGLIREAAKQKQKIQVVRVDGAPTVAMTAVFSTGGKNQTFRNRDLEDFVGQTLKFVNALQPKAAEADVLGALTKAAHVTPANGTIVLIDSGLATIGPLSFLNTKLRTADPIAVAMSLDTQHLMPKLTGLSIVLVGVGNTADPQPQLDENLNNRVAVLWHTVVERAGAGCVLDLATPQRRAATDRALKVTIMEP